jgi:dynein light intermediate chain 1
VSLALISLDLCGRILLTWTIGGTPESQREFLDTFSADTSADPSLVNEKRKGKTPPIANHFALGYTYRDVLDADQEGKANITSYSFAKLTLH